MRKRLLSVLLISAMTGTLTSCSGTVVMTEKQSELAAEYISSVILKYNQKETSSKLIKLDGTEVEADKELDADDTETESIETNNTEAKDAEVSQTNQEDVLDRDVASREEVTLESLYGFTDVKVTYDNVKEYKTYPAGSKDAITASEGHKFLVVGFTLKNNSDKDVQIDVLKDNVTFSIKANGEEWISGVHTLLANDLTYYQGKIKAGKSKKAVVLFEVQDSFQLSDATFYAMTDSKKACEVMIK